MTGSSALWQNSLCVTLLTTLLALGMGMAVGIASAVSGPRLRWILLAGSVTAFALPSFFITGCWLHWMGDAGVLGQYAPIKLFTPAGTSWVIAMQLWPVTAMACAGQLERLDVRWMESDPALRGTRLFLSLILPRIRGSLLQSSLIVAALAATNFTVPAILQTKVYPAEIWLRFNTDFDFRSAFLLSLPLLVIAAVTGAFSPDLNWRWPAGRNDLHGERLGRQLGKGWRLSCSTIATGILAISVLLPLGFLMTDVRTWLELPGAISAGQSAIVHSVIYAAGAATLIILAGWQMSSRPARAFAWMLLVAPGVLLGIGSIYLFNRPATGWLYPGHALVMALLTLKYLIVGLLVRRTVLGSVAGAWMEQAGQAGASRWQRWVEIEWPRSRVLLTVGWTTAFVFCLWDVETILMILPPGAETLSVRVFNLLHYGHNSQVNALCLTMMILALIPAGFLLLQGRQRMSVLIAILIPAVLAGCGDGSSSPKVPDLKSAFFGEVQIIGSRGTGAGQFNKPRSVAVDKAGNIYAIDMTGRLQKFDASGKFVKSYQMPQTDKGRPKGMCIDELGRVVLVEPHYSRLNYFTPELELVAQWGIHGTNSGELSFPRSVAVRSGGTVLVSEYGAVERIQWFEREGKRWLGETRAAGIAAGEFNRPEGIGLDLKGNLYVADSCNHRVQVFDPAGKVLRLHGKAGPGSGEFSYPYDVRVDRDGYEFVCEFGNSRIQIFDSAGRSVEILGGAGGEAGNFSNPWAIALDEDGNLYVADSGNHRIQKFVRKRAPMASARGGEGNR